MGTFPKNQRESRDTCGRRVRILHARSLATATAHHRFEFLLGARENGRRRLKSQRKLSSSRSGCTSGNPWVTAQKTAPSPLVTPTRTFSQSWHKCGSSKKAWERSSRECQCEHHALFHLERCWIAQRPHSQKWQLSSALGQISSAKPTS